MKLTKKLEAEILKVYHAYWDAYFKGDMKTFASMMDENLSVFGSAVSEVFNSKKQAVKFYTATAHEMTGQAQFHNRTIRLQAAENNVIIKDENDLYILIDKKWTFYSHCRISAVMQPSNRGWKLIHQHASFPDSKVDEGSQIAAEKIKKENLQLKEAVQRRTVELETKNRELEIETALEKVRTIAMSMKKADDMLLICKTISQQLQKLSVKEIRNVQTAIIHREKGTYTNYEFYTKHNQLLTTEVSYTNHSMSKAFVKKMQEGPKEFFKRSLKGKKVQEWYAFQKKSTNQFADTYLAKASSLNYYWYSLGPVALGVSTYAPLSKEEEELVIRFKNVFELAYRRYMDIEKATAQAREAQIETALERIRAAAMAMRNSTELGSIIYKLNGELTKLDAKLDRCFIMIVHRESNGITWWLAGKEGLLAENGFFIQANEHPTHVMYLENCKKRKKRWHYIFEGKEKRDWDKFGFSKTELSRLPEFVKKDMAAVKKVHLSGSSDQFGSLVTGSLDPLPEEQQEIISRFTVVFNQAYTRFLDLQKAEAQAREAKIEAALERVRARSLAMHKSEELKEVIKVVLEQFVHLSINVEHAGFYIDYKAHDDMHIWLADPNIEPFYATLPYFDTPTWNSFLEAKAKGTVLHTDLLDFKTKNKFYKSLFKIVTVPKKAQQFYLQCKGLAVSTVLLDTVGLYIENFSAIPYTNEENNILIRFGNVFQQTYTRFLDLQKAEAQSRESQIQLALERVRARTMAMHKSDELPETSHLLFEQMKELGEPVEQLTIGIVNEENKVIEISATLQGDTLKKIYNHSIDEPYMMAKVYKAWKHHQKTVVIELHGDELNAYNKFRNELTNSNMFPTNSGKEDRRIVYAAFFSKGMLALGSNETHPPESLQLLEKFASVFDLTYTRFLDLQKAEAQAREAQIEAALEKVRSRTLAMQKSDELAGTAAVLFQQLIALGIAPNRLYIILIKEGSPDMDAWVTDEDGSKVSMGFTGNYNKNASLKKMYEGWVRQKKSLVIDMQGEELQDYFHYLHDDLKVSFKGGLKQIRRIQHLAYFSHGLIGMASPDEQPAETLQLMERFAAVFNLTFTRFNDLKIAEAHALQAEQDLIAIKEAKQKAEEALTELQATQKQLIQSEKMASLGELTAGIAHEIQNPLNFVNNFSEVSGELLKELVDEVDKGNTDEVKFIADDLIGNLEKINHHGKRAADIVKGMLQHSRSSSGVKELTDINSLCDEYLRLAYHGLRAKDKSFNAKFEKSLDENIGKINIMPQEIGRVVLNLINNAFYAVSAKTSATAGGNYEPTVTVTTKKENGKVLITVADNGTGIPKKALDKIFQPFFTTKPTGQGTGLGLSLSYDIVKAHGGELRVETKEGEGTSFIIVLPAY